jgi:hypothetical protein
MSNIGSGFLRVVCLACVAIAPAAAQAPLQGTILAGPDTSGNQVRSFNGAGTPKLNFSPLPAGYNSGVRVAAGDLNGDGVADLIISLPSGQAPTVRVFSGTSGALLDSFDAYPAAFTGGVYVAAGDLNGDGRTDLITGTGAAVGVSGHVKVFDGRTGALIRSFFPYDAAFGGGVTVAAGDVDGDGRADIITGAASASRGHVKVFDGRTGAELHSFFAYDAGFTGGVSVAGGDVDGDGRDDIITGAGPGATPHVKVFSGSDLTSLGSFFAFNVGFSGGVRVAAGDLNGDGLADLIVGAGPGSGPGPAVARFLSPGSTSAGSFFAFDPAFTGGIHVAGELFVPVVFRDGYEQPPVDQ